jgi:RimJ/RimL family protein N-acetyltransferase
MQKAFLSGKIIGLRKPDLELDIMQGEWHEWFNDYNTTQYLIHGLFPVSREEEYEIVKKNLNRSDSLILTVVDIKSEDVLGVISLMSIDHINRRAEIAIVMGKRSTKIGAAVEAMALLTQHAFDRLNLEKIYAGQHESLWKWINTLELIGYQIEGYRKKYGRRNCNSYGIVLTGVTVEKLNDLREQRNGDILNNNVADLLRKRCKINRIPQLSEYLESISSI